MDEILSSEKRINLRSLISCLQLSKLAAMETWQNAYMEIDNLDESKTDLFFPLPQEIVAQEIFKNLVESSGNLKDLWKNIKSFEKLSKYVRSEIYKKNLNNLVVKRKKEILEKIWKFLWDKFKFHPNKTWNKLSSKYDSSLLKNVDDIDAGDFSNRNALAFIIDSMMGVENKDKLPPISNAKIAIELLVKNGINIESKHWLMTSLMWAVECEHPDVVQFLVDNGANI